MVVSDLKVIPQYVADWAYRENPDYFRREDESNLEYIWRGVRPVKLSEETLSLMKPNDRQDIIFGTSFLLASYGIQIALLAFGPPWVKALGGAFAVAPMMDPFVFGTGVLVSNVFF